MPYEIICHEYDAAPDATSQYFVAKRRTAKDLQTAKQFAYDEVEDNFMTGATVFDENKKPVYSVGMQFEYVEKRQPDL